MFSGFSSYLGFHPQGSESVQALLQKSDLALDELLDDEGLLTELKTLNSDLLNFMKTEENFTKLINHVILEPSSNEQQLNPQRCFKFPLVCTDVLSSECAPLVVYLLNCNVKDNDANEEEDGDCDESKSPNSLEGEKESRKAQENNEDFKYIDYLFGFLDKQELNYTAAGYFARIITNLLEKHSSGFLAYLYKKRPEHLEKLANHISSESIADVLLKAITFEATAIDDASDEVYHAARVQTLKQLVQKLDAQQHPELASNAAYIISEAIERYKTVHKGTQIISCLLETEAVEDFYKILKTKDVISISAVTTVLEKIFEHEMAKASEKGTDNENDSPFGGFQKQETSLSSGFPIVVGTIGNIESIVNIIGEALNVDVPFGNFRMKLIDLISTMIEAKNSDLNAKIVESDFLNVLLKLFIKFEWHNILHNKAEKLIISVIDGEDEGLKVSLFESGQLLRLIEEAFRETAITTTTKSGKKIRKGYLGQLVKIANKILDCEDPVVERYTDGNETWEEYSIVELEAINKVQKIKLGGVNPKIERYGSFEIQHWSTLACVQNKEKEEDQQNDQEGCPEPAFKINMDDCDCQEDVPSMKTVHLKFSQLGSPEKLARRRSSRDHSNDQEIVEEIVATTSPVLQTGIKYFKFEEVIDECIEEDIQADQNSPDDPRIKKNGGPKITGKFF